MMSLISDKIKTRRVCQCSFCEWCCSSQLQIAIKQNYQLVSKPSTLWEKQYNSIRWTSSAFHKVMQLYFSGVADNS